MKSVCECSLRRSSREKVGVRHCMVQVRNCKMKVRYIEVSVLVSVNWVGGKVMWGLWVCMHWEGWKEYKGKRRILDILLELLIGILKRSFFFLHGKEFLQLRFSWKTFHKKLICSLPFKSFKFLNYETWNVDKKYMYIFVYDWRIFIFHIYFL